MTIEDLKQHPILERDFRTNSKNMAATEIAYITRYLNGEKELKGSFSYECLAIVMLFNTITPL